MFSYESTCKRIFKNLSYCWISEWIKGQKVEENVKLRMNVDVASLSDTDWSFYVGRSLILMYNQNTGHLKQTNAILTAEMYWLLKQGFSWVGEVMEE